MPLIDKIFRFHHDSWNEQNSMTIIPEFNTLSFTWNNNEHEDNFQILNRVNLSIIPTNKASIQELEPGTNSKEIFLG